MIVMHFRAQCRPERIEEALAVFREVVAPSRRVEGVISFDITHDLTDPNTIIAVEVFADEEAIDRQESLPEVGAVMALLPDVLAAPGEATVFHVSSSEAR
jgi:quinol monooxygenase YgiN